MSQINLLQVLPRISQMRKILIRHTAYRYFGISRMISQKPSSPTTAPGEPKENDGPIKYFSSPAARWKAEQTRSGQATPDMPWYQPYVVNFSVAIFLLYFCVLREENDIDRGLEKSLYDHIPGLEEKQLLVNYNYNIEHGASTIEVEKRMNELGIEY